MDTLPDIRARDADHCVATWHRTVIMLARGVARAEHVVSAGEAARALLAVERSPVQLLLIVEPSSPAPAGKALEEFVKFSRDVVPQLSAAVAVAEGGGFRAAMMRSVAASLAMAMPKRLPYQFTSSVEQAAAILARHLPKGCGGAAALERAVAALRPKAA